MAAIMSLVLVSAGKRRTLLQKVQVSDMKMRARQATASLQYL